MEIYVHRIEVWEVQDGVEDANFGPEDILSVCTENTWVIPTW